MPMPVFTSWTDELLYCILNDLPFDDTNITFHSTTQELLYAILLKGMLSGYYVGTRNYFETGMNLTIPLNHQYIVHQQITILGHVTVNGHLIIN